MKYVRIIILFGLMFTSWLFATSDAFPPNVNPPTVADFLPSPNNIYYCATNGSNTTGNGLIGSPWYDLEGGRGTVAAGDLVYFRGGNYNVNGFTWSDGSENSLRVDGTAQNPIVISNYPGEQVVYTSQTTAITLAGEYQKLIGTKVSTAYGWQINGGASFDDSANNSQVSGVHFRLGGTYGSNPAMLTYPHNTTTIQNLVIRHNRFEDSQHNGSENRMVCIRFFTTQNTIVEYNIFEDNSELYQGGCIYFKDATADAIVRYNKFINSAGGIGYCVQGNAFNGLDVYGNLSYNCRYFIYFVSDLGNVDEINIFDNVVLGLTSACMYYLNADNQTWTEHGDFYNNVIDGRAAIEGWHSNSDDLRNLPDLWDYNLWYSLSDRTAPSGWSWPTGYFTHSVIGFNAVIYDSQIVFVTDDYVGRTTGRFGDCIGGFLWEENEGVTPPVNVLIK